MPGNPNPNDVPVLFFSRNIGLNAGQEVPIDAGGRMTGKAGPFSIGLLDIRTGDSKTAGVEPTNFGVVRVKRDILRRSAVGVLFTDRSISSAGTGESRAYGVDGVFSFYQNLNFSTYFARTDNPGGSGRDTSYRTQLDYNADRYGLQIERLAADERFNPEVGFMRRSAFTRNSSYFRFSPRPKAIKGIRKFTYDVSYDYITDPDGTLQSRQAQGAFRTELSSGDSFFIEGASVFESLEQPFAISSNVTIPVGGYGYPELHLQYGFGSQRKISGVMTLERGRFYNGTRTGLTTGRGRFEITSQIAIEPNVTINWIDLPEGKFTQALLTSRLSYTLTPRMSASALIQYSSSTTSVNTNVRFRWEYQPGSDLFLVYSDNRDTTGTGFPALRNRGIVLKLTRLFRM